MKKYLSLVLCLFIISFSCICVYAGHSQEYADAVIGKIESIEQTETYYPEGHSYFVDINNDGTDEVILMYYDSLPYWVLVNSYAPEYSMSENNICSEEAIYEAYSFSGNISAGEVSAYKNGNYLVIKSTTFIINGLPNGEPAPAEAAAYKKYKIGDRGEVVLVSEGAWAYYEENSQYYTRKGEADLYFFIETDQPSSKDDVDSLIAEFEKGEKTLLYTVDYQMGDGVKFSADTLTFEQTVEKMQSGITKEAPEDEEDGETKPQDSISEESTQSSKDGGSLGVLPIALIVAVLILVAVLVIVIRKNKKQ
ncbi:MAG: hypothetical protein E7406_00870 [Ruminococcaceae bacterium]|nr:hypothetical protein [Oscillospiraceae bacterium]